MNQSRLEKIVSAYFPESEFSSEHIRFARLVAENVERETRQEAVSLAYELANSLANSPRHNESKSK